jgi:hypothetical protein
MQPLSSFRLGGALPDAVRMVVADTIEVLARKIIEWHCRLLGGGLMGVLLSNSHGNWDRV